MEIIAKCLGGSHMYGLNGPESDIDYRGVFLNDNINDIIGLGKNEHALKQDEDNDQLYTEFRHTLNLLRQGNTQSFELLFNEKWIEISDEWKSAQKVRLQLIDSERLFKCLLGYMQGERRLAMGERKGKLGGKRYEQFLKYGYSPKNIVQLLRLAWCGIFFFENSVFPTRIKDYDTNLHNLLIDIKFSPEKFQKEKLLNKIDFYESKLKGAFSLRDKTYKFNSDLANDLILKAYKKFLT